MELGQLAGQVDGARLIGDPKTSILGIEYDSRLVKPGSAFVALRGGYTDGHAFADQAAAAGAAALVVEEQLPIAIPQVIVPATRRDLATLAASFYGHPSEALSVIGVTGTDGKTTTSYLIDHILRDSGITTGMVGTVSVRIGTETVDHETRQTTPESADIQRLLRQMVDASVQVAILEATSHGLDLHRLDHVRFEIGVVTNITYEHLEHHKTVERYWRAKAILFERVAAAGGIAVVNLDDEGARSMLRYTHNCARVLTYSQFDESADLVARVYTSDLTGSTGTVRWDGREIPMRLPLVGDFNVSNALAALATAIGAGIDVQAATASLATVSGIPGRMVNVEAGQPFGVVVDYAHTPESLAKVLRLLRRLRPTGRLIAVFGSAGERDTTKRPIQGSIAAELADVVVVTNEDPRFEAAETIIDQIVAGAVLAGAVPGRTVFAITERREAITRAFQLAAQGDTVLLAGKGHERSIIWNGVKHLWDEQRVALELLADLGWTEAQV